MNLLDDKKLSLSRVFWYGLIISLIALSPAIIRYHGAYVTRGDYLEQQLPFLAESGRILRNGLDVYSFNTFLGAPAIGSYAFYTLGSPFVWILALMPKSALPYGVTIMGLLKHAFCVLSAFLYLRKMVSRATPAFLGAILYTFSSFTVVNTQFYHFTEVIAFFPLILLGIENIMRNDFKPGHLAIICGLNTLVNYYFMFGSALLVVLYVAFRFFSPAWDTPYRFRKLILVVLESALGCALAGFLLCPAMLYMLQITRNGSGTDLFYFFSISDILERLRVLFMPIESTVVHAYYGDAASWTSTAAWLPLFGFTGTLCFIVGRKQNTSLWLFRLILLLLVFSFIPALCGIFVLESNPVYTRWWYGLVLMLVLATLYELDSDTPISGKNQKAFIRSFYLCTVIVFLLTIPFLIPEEFLQEMADRSSFFIWNFLLHRKSCAHADIPFILLSLISTGASGLLFLICLRKKNPFISFAQITIATAFIAAFAYAGYIFTGDTCLLSGGEQPGHGKYELQDIAGPTLSALKLEDCPEYKRIDYGLKLRNYGLLRGTSSLTVFHSLRQSVTGRFIALAGFGYNESTTVYPPGSDGAIRAFLSVGEYHQTDPDDTVPEGFIYDREENGFPVYINPNQVPMGFLQTTCTGTHEQPMNPDTLGPTLLAAVTLDEPWLSRARETMTTLNVHAIPDWKESVQRLQAQSCDQFVPDAHGFTAHINADTSGYLVFTVPYDKGFTARIDGIQTEIIPCDIAFMAVSLTPGEHTIRFDYHNRGLSFGLFVSISAVAVLIIYRILIGKRFKAARLRQDTK